MRRKVLRSLMLMTAALAGIAVFRAGAAPLPSGSPSATQPAISPAAAKAAATASKILEIRATEAFNGGQYAMALPMLRKVAEDMKDQPDRAAFVREEIKICEQAIEGGDTGTAPGSMGNLAIQAVEKSASATQPAVVASAQPAAAQPSAAAVPSKGTVQPVAAVAPVDPQSAYANDLRAMNADTRKVHPAMKDGEVAEMAIKELGNFEYDPERPGTIPADVQRLSGHIIRTHGFMLPLDQAEGITEFALVPSLFNCCIGQPPQIQHTIVVHCPKGKAVSYYGDEIVVEGTLKVEEKKDDGYVVSVFEMEARSVKPAAK